MLIDTIEEAYEWLIKNRRWFRYRDADFYVSYDNQNLMIPIALMHQLADQQTVEIHRIDRFVVAAYSVLHDDDICY